MDAEESDARWVNVQHMSKRTMLCTWEDANDVRRRMEGSFVVNVDALGLEGTLTAPS